MDCFPAAAQVYRNLRDEMDHHQPATMTSWGWTLAGNEEMVSGNFEKIDTACVRRLLGEVDIFINIGAHVGYYCCHALELGKPVIAVEPIHRNLRYLLRNLAQNPEWIGRSEVWPVALAEKVGIVEMWGGGTGASLIQSWVRNSDNYVRKVPTVPLDRLLADRIRGLRALILADVEGAETALLEGAPMVLAMEPKPAWILEVTKSKEGSGSQDLRPDIQLIFQVMHRAGYRAADMEAAARGQILPLELAELRPYQGSPNCLFLGQSRIDAHSA